ncbi:hypothetical protein [Streptomyces sp. LaBMicrA B280]|uniref:hypothetical protein n=1 Tax=Streptomyces sp. LaBMicrA B280 TaxID=3391001 RepID=UPI003BA41E05
MSHNELFAPTAVITPVRVFLPGLRTGARRLPPAGAPVGVAEPRHLQQGRTAVSAPTTTVAARDTGA